MAILSIASQPLSELTPIPRHLLTWASLLPALPGALFLLQAHRTYRKSTKLRQDAGIPQGSIQTADGYTAPSLNLAGRPDEVMTSRGGRRVIERKSSTPYQAKAQPEPWHTDRYQLMANMALVAETYGDDRVEGILHYNGGIRFTLSYDDTSRKRLKHVLDQMTHHVDTGIPAQRHHSNPAKCNSCDYKERCPERLPPPAPRITTSGE